MSWWKKYEKKHLGNDGLMDETLTKKSRKVNLNLSNYCQLLKSYVLNMFVNIQEGENPSVKLPKTALYAIAAIIIGVLIYAII